MGKRLFNGFFHARIEFLNKKREVKDLPSQFAIRRLMTVIVFVRMFLCILN